jgi:hypothetical protein
MLLNLQPKNPHAMPQFQVAALYAFFALTLPGGQKFERLQLLPPAKECSFEQKHRKLQT